MSVPADVSADEKAKASKINEIIEYIETGHPHDGIDGAVLAKGIIETYTGDGGVDKEIVTGLSSLLLIVVFGDEIGTYYLKTSEHPATGSHSGADGSYEETRFGASGISGGSFFVDDNGTDDNPNKDGQGYIYFAYGNP